MEFKTIFEAYSTKMTQIYLYQRAMQELAKKEFQKLYEYENSLKKKPEMLEMPYSHHNMYFRTARDGTYQFFGSKKSSVKERRLSMVLHKNKQYQWLLAEAYEGFEDYIEDLYACAGFKNNDFWPLHDYGNITLSEIKSKPFEWFQFQAKKKKDRPASIINRFRESIPNLAAVEAKNGLETNLRLAITLVEFLRHIIVHKGGNVSDKDEFIKEVLQKSGLYNNGNYESSHLNLINAFFGDREYENTILLLEIPNNPEIPLDTYINVFEVLSNYLMAYAHLVQEEVENYITNQISRAPV